MAHPASGGILEPTQRQYKMNNILRIVSELQQLLYTNLATAVSPECSKYLQYVQDDHITNFKLLKLPSLGQLLRIILHFQIYPIY